MPNLADLDPYDRRLLVALQRDCLRTAQDLAREIPLSPSSIARRIRRLRDAGIIERGVAIVATGRHHLSAVVDVQLDRHALPQVEALIRRLNADDRVQALFELAGAFDLMLLVLAADMQAFNDFADTVLGSHAAVRRYETRFVKKRRKYSTLTPVEGLDIV